MGALGAQSRVFPGQLSHGALLLNIGARRAQNLAHIHTFLIAGPAFGTRSLGTDLMDRPKVTLVTLHGGMRVPRRTAGQLRGEEFVVLVGDDCGVEAVFEGLGVEPVASADGEGELVGFPPCCCTCPDPCSVPWFCFVPDGWL